jgi:hypothetical protein
MKTIAIIGAGMAGLACAGRLNASGIAVTVFDKGRGVGGRMATRRVETAEGRAQFDHGAQFLTVRSEIFRAALERVSPSVAAWPSGDQTRQGGDRIDPAPDQRLIGAPSMSALPRSLSEGLDVRTSVRIISLERSVKGWTLNREDGGVEGPYDAISLAIPAEQAAPLLAPHSPDLAHEAATAQTAPCWAGLFAYKKNFDPEFEALKLSDHPILSWIARDTSKSGRPTDLSCWVVHARPDWSLETLEHAPKDILPILQSALAEHFHAPAAPTLAQAHRWRYALVQRHASTSFGWDPDLALGTCGDWRLGPRVEAAWISGYDLAGAMGA